MGGKVEVGQLLAGASIQLAMPGVQEKLFEQLGDVLMEALLEQPGVIDPIVSNDLDAAELSISFEFEATGEVATDGQRGIALFVEALKRAAASSTVPFDWEGWWADGASHGRLEYPLVAATS